MNFKEMLEKYKSGSISPEEQKIIEAEIEKNEAINEYLSEQIMDVLSDAKNEMPHKEKSDTVVIRKKMNRKFGGVIFAAVAIVVALFCAVQFVVFPLINNSYYNPMDGQQYSISSYSELGQMSIDMSVFSELHLRGYETPFVIAKSEGLGKYDITLLQYDTFRNYLETQYHSQIVRGELDKAMLGNALTRGLGFNWVQSAYGEYTDTEKIGTIDSASRAELSRLPESAEIKAYLFFDETIDMQTLADLVRQDDLNVLWAGIRCSDSELLWESKFGFSPLGKYIPLPENAYDAPLYPALELDDTQPFGGADRIDYTKLNAASYEAHFISLLQYMANKKDFMSVIGFEYDYNSALSYVQENGIFCNGIVVSGSREAIETMTNNSMVRYIAIDDVVVSAFSKN